MVQRCSHADFAQPFCTDQLHTHQAPGAGKPAQYYPRAQASRHRRASVVPARVPGAHRQLDKVCCQAFLRRPSRWDHTCPPRSWHPHSCFSPQARSLHATNTALRPPSHASIWQRAMCTYSCYAAIAHCAAAALAMVHGSDSCGIVSYPQCCRSSCGLG